MMGFVYHPILPSIRFQVKADCGAGRRGARPPPGILAKTGGGGARGDADKPFLLLSAKAAVVIAMPYGSTAGFPSSLTGFPRLDKGNRSFAETGYHTVRRAGHDPTR